MVDSIGYSVEGRDKGIEIRKYPDMVLATVYGHSDNDAFSLLFNYISGENRSKRSIPMTTPVISSEKIPMTTPVISDNRSFSFVMPAGYALGTVPEPLDQRVKMEAVPARRMAVIRFRGRTGRKAVERRTSMLLSYSEKLGLEVKGKPFLMRYNPPFVPGFLRRNEISIEISK